MRNTRPFGGCLAIVLLSIGTARAGLIVDPPLPITHRVHVQIIETAMDNGTQPATIFGNASQRSKIESGVDSIWAQAGIDIQFLPTIVHYDDTFALQGNGGLRPDNDLNLILNNAASEGGILNSDSSVINMFFAKIVPGFDFTDQNTANSLAQVGHNGIAQFVGRNLLSFQTGRDVISGVVAHEIGHNLGLKHPLLGMDDNLMTSDGSTAQLTAAQINAIFQTNFRSDLVAFIPSGGTGFPQPLPLLGDMDLDEDVDFDDIDDWLLGFNSPEDYQDAYGVSPIDRGDMDLDGDLDFDDIVGFVNKISDNGVLAGDFQVVPEPTTELLVGLSLWCLGGWRRAIRRS